MVMVWQMESNILLLQSSPFYSCCWVSPEQVSCQSILSTLKQSYIWSTPYYLHQLDRCMKLHGHYFLYMNLVVLSRITIFRNTCKQCHDKFIWILDFLQLRCIVFENIWDIVIKITVKVSFVTNQKVGQTVMQACEVYCNISTPLLSSPSMREEWIQWKMREWSKLSYSNSLCAVSFLNPKLITRSWTDIWRMAVALSSHQ